MKKIYVRLAKTLMLWGANKLYNYIDKGEDGIDKEDIRQFVAELRIVLSKVMKKL